MIVVLILALGLIGLYAGYLWAKRAAKNTQQEALYAKALEAETEGFNRVLIKISRPFARLPFANDKESSLYRYFKKKLSLAGGAFGGSVEVFLAILGLCGLLATVGLLLTATGLVPFYFGALPGLCVLLLPIASVNRRARERQEEIMRGLPEFAELLQMPLVSGMSVIASLEFTARNTRGPVSEEAANLVLLTRTRALPEAEAFALAGERLGTPEARSFFNVLAQAYFEGAHVVRTISRQAKALRIAQFQREREKIKKLPVRLIVVFAIHFLAPILLIIGIQIAAGFSGI